MGPITLSAIGFIIEIIYKLFEKRSRRVVLITVVVLCSARHLDGRSLRHIPYEFAPLIFYFFCFENSNQCFAASFEDENARFNTKTDEKNVFRPNIALMYVLDFPKKISWLTNSGLSILIVVLNVLERFWCCFPSFWVL